MASNRHNRRGRGAARRTRRTPLTLTMAIATALSAFASPARGNDESYESRRAKLQQMGPDELLELGRKRERFAQLPAAQQDELRHLHADLQADSQADKLQTILDRYHRWLQTLPAAQRAELLSLPAEERVAKIRKIQQEQKNEDERRFGGGSRPISPEDQQAVLDWLDQLAQRHESDLLKNLPTRMKEFLEQLPDVRRRRILLIGNSLRPRGDGAKPFAPSNEEVDELARRLSPSVRRDLSNRGSKEATDRLQDLIRIAIFNLWQPTQAELEKFYAEDLSAADQEWLDAMPRERFQRELRKLYFEQMGRRGGGPDGLRPQFPGQFPGRGPGSFGDGMPRGFKGGEGRGGKPSGQRRPDGPPPENPPPPQKPPQP